MTERRKHARANSKIEFLCYDINKLEIVYSIKSKNISAGGLLLIYNKDFPQGTVLNIGVDLNRSDCGAETVKSKVLRSRKVADNIYELGVQFLNMSDELNRCIVNHVNENLEQEPLSDYQEYLKNNRVWRLGAKSKEES